MSIDWPTELVTAIARRRSVVVLGSGVSRQSVSASGQRPPAWDQLLTQGVSRLISPNTIKTAIRRAIRTGDYLLACQMVKEQMGDPEFHEFLREQFLTPHFQPAAIHDSIINTVCCFGICICSHRSQRLADVPEPVLKSFQKLGFFHDVVKP